MKQIMAATFAESNGSSSANDPLFPWLLLIKKALDEWYSGNRTDTNLDKLSLDCITTFKHNARGDFEAVFREMVENKICVGHSLLYEWYAYFLEAKGKWKEADMVYQIGISRKAEPLEKLKKAQSLFVKRMSERLSSASFRKVSMPNEEKKVIFFQNIPITFDVVV